MPPTPSCSRLLFGQSLLAFALAGTFALAGCDEPTPNSENTSVTEPAAPPELDELATEEEVIEDPVTRPSVVEAPKPDLEPGPEPDPEIERLMGEDRCIPQLPVHEAVERASVGLLQAVACGRSALRDVLSDERGVLHVVIEDDDDGGPERRDAGVLCGSDLRTFERELQSELELDVLQHMTLLPDMRAIRCSELACTLPAHTEWDNEKRFVFERNDEGQLFLRAVIEADTLMVHDEVARERLSWANTAYARVEDETCAP